MSSLQAALPNNQAPATYVGDADESWFTQNPVPSYIPGGVAFDPPNGIFSFLFDCCLKFFFLSHYLQHQISASLSAGSLGYIVGQAPSTQIP